MLHGVVVIAATLKDPGFDSYQGVASLTVTAKAGVMYLPRYSTIVCQIPTFRIQHSLHSFEIQWFELRQIIDKPYLQYFEKCIKDFTFPLLMNLEPDPDSPISAGKPNRKQTA